MRTLNKALAALDTAKALVKEAYQARIRMPARQAAYYVAKDNFDDDEKCRIWVRSAELAQLELPKPVVLVNGAFDILHSGHMKTIFTARARAGTLIAAVDSDARVRAAKPGRPIQSLIERVHTLCYMPIDYVVEIRQDQDMADLIDAVDPDLRVQGSDYKNVPSKYQIRKCFVRGAHMRTSTIIERCRQHGPGSK